jgi:hypothetical protein
MSAGLRYGSTRQQEFEKVTHRARQRDDGYGGFVCEIDLPLLDWCVFPVEFEA